MDAAAGVVATLVIPNVTTLRLTADELVEGYAEGAQRHKLNGLISRVEEGGSVNRRFTVTRIAMLGVLAAGVPKRIDDRELYLTIEGPDTVIVHAIPVKKNATLTSDARRFVSKLNQLSGDPAPAKTSAATPFPTEPPTYSSDGLSTKLEQLASLRDRGVITAAEFDAKRADLIARF